MRKRENPAKTTSAINLLLVCGLFSAVLYFSMNIYIPLLYTGYDVASQTISELSAVGAPTRPLWVVLGSIYGILVVFFGRGIYKVAGSNSRLRIAGLLIMASAIIGLFWPPMHQRQVLAAGGGTMTDTLHIVFTFITVPLMLAATFLAGSSFGKTFLAYSILTIIIQVGFGILTGLDAKAMQANEPTPFMGIWERISIGVYMLWQVALALRLFYVVNSRYSTYEADTAAKRFQYMQGVD